MNGYKIALLAWYAISALIIVATIGKPKKPTTPRQAAILLTLLGGIATLVVLA